MSNFNRDITGIGSLNLDYILTKDETESLPQDVLNDLILKLKYGAEKLNNLDYIKNIIDSLGVQKFKIVLGGSAFNTVRAIAGLENGIKTGFSGIACDTGIEGLDFIKTMDTLSIDHAYTKFCETQSTGVCISINSGGTRSFICCPGSNNKMSDYIFENYDSILKYIAESKILHVTQFADEGTTEALAMLLHEAKKSNPLIKLSCDPGYCWLAAISPAVADIIKLSDLIFVNNKEFNLMTEFEKEMPDLEKAMKIFMDYDFSDTQLILKDETEIKLYHKDEKNVVENIFAIDVVREEDIIDATGAGDMFAAGLLTEYIKNGEINEKAINLGMKLMKAKLTMTADEFYSKVGIVYKKIMEEQYGK